MTIWGDIFGEQAEVTFDDTITTPIVEIGRLIELFEECSRPVSGQDLEDLRLARKAWMAERGLTEADMAGGDGR